MDIKDIREFTKELNILYVEDDVETIEHVSSILTSLFLKVDIANDGKLGLEAYNNYFNKNIMNYIFTKFV